MKRGLGALVDPEKLVRMISELPGRCGLGYVRGRWRKRVEKEQIRFAIGRSRP